MMQYWRMMNCFQYNWLPPTKQ